MTGTEAHPAHYSDAELIRLYDLEMPDRPDHDFYVALASRPVMRILDVGCGSGTLALRLAARGHDVTAVDPAPGMLQAARAKPGAGGVTWVEADARDLALGITFDLIIMTGHAFQALLSDDDQRRALRALARHLDDNGLLAFETRNPDVAEWRTWTKARSRIDLSDPILGDVEVHWEAKPDTRREVIALETHYHFKRNGSHRLSHSLLRFAPQSTIARHLADAGLLIEAWYGDWDRSSVRADAPELIAVARRRPD